MSEGQSFGAPIWYNGTKMDSGRRGIALESTYTA